MRLGLCIDVTRASVVLGALATGCGVDPTEATSEIELSPNSSGQIISFGDANTSWEQASHIDIVTADTGSHPTMVTYPL